MLCCIHAIDKTGQEELRSLLLNDQINYVNSQDEIKIVLAGPLSKQYEEDLSGSLLIIDAKSRAAVDKFIKHSPFFSNALWECIMVNKFTPTNTPQP